MDVLVFRTSVSMMHQVEQLSVRLDKIVGKGQWSFDLEDCDRVLRVVGSSSQKRLLVALLSEHGHHCAELEDNVVI